MIIEIILVRGSLRRLLHEQLALAAVTLIGKKQNEIRPSRPSQTGVAS